MSEIESPAVTIKLAGSSEAWVEHAFGGSINAAYPHSEEPMAFLAARGLSFPAELHVELDGWKPEVYATFETWSLEEGNLRQTAEFMDRLFAAIHNLDGDYGTLDVEFRELL
jgi:hypothetical protein